MVVVCIGIGLLEDRLICWFAFVSNEICFYETFVNQCQVLKLNNNSSRLLPFYGTLLLLVTRFPQVTRYFVEPRIDNNKILSCY